MRRGPLAAGSVTCAPGWAVLPSCDMLRVLVLLPILLEGLAPRVAAQPVPLGDDFQVNTYATGGQGRSKVAVHDDGSFVVVWWDHGAVDGLDGSEDGVFGRRFDAAGMPLGAQFPVNTYTVGDQLNPAVASDGKGGFVVTWTDGFSADGRDGSAEGIFARRYDASGAPVGGELAVNTYTTGSQADPAVAMTPTGEFVIAWPGAGSTDPSGIFARRFDATGAPAGDEFPVNTYTTGFQQRASVDLAADGSFVVVWTSPDEDGDGVFARRFNVNGTPAGGQFQVNTYTTSDQSQGHVSIGADGTFVVVWRDGPPFSGDGRDGSSTGVFGRRYDATGTPLGGEFMVNTYTTSYQGFPSVAHDASSSFLVAWLSDSQDGSLGGPFAQHFDPSGVKVGGEFQVNTQTSGNQYQPWVAASPDGNFVVTWSSPSRDGDGSAVVARPFREPCGDGQLAAGEDCDDDDRVAGDCCSPLCVFETGTCEDDDACTGPGTCVGGTCVGDPACDDGSRCTSDDTCREEMCVGSVADLSGLLCRVDQIRGAPCGNDTPPRKTGKQLDGKLWKTFRFVERAANGEPDSRERGKLVRRAGRQLDAIDDLATRAARARKDSRRISEACRARLDATTRELRALLAALL